MYRGFQTTLAHLRDVVSVTQQQDCDRDEAVTGLQHVCARDATGTGGRALCGVHAAGSGVNCMHKFSHQDA